MEKLSGIWGNRRDKTRLFFQFANSVLSDLLLFQSYSSEQLTFQLG
ncbi:hypothetical protein RV10_GL002382 [Enterococcus pallens]|nr:hypothetical protein RV10_GL002382 [Enterococcus pallens]